MVEINNQNSITSDTLSNNQHIVSNAKNIHNQNKKKVPQKKSLKAKKKANSKLQINIVYNNKITNIITLILLILIFKNLITLFYKYNNFVFYKYEDLKKFATHVENLYNIQLNICNTMACADILSCNIVEDTKLGYKNLSQFYKKNLLNDLANLTNNNKIKGIEALKSAIFCYFNSDINKLLNI